MGVLGVAGFAVRHTTNNINMPSDSYTPLQYTSVGQRHLRTRVTDHVPVGFLEGLRSVGYHLRQVLVLLLCHVVQPAILSYYDPHIL